ncbi:MAG TPA: ABC transporter substrate-binding protein [Acidimicrobiales bacterium]|nr:ABC transporter substrate-binding protein [Acidimicrobiales bacterium]
MYRSLRVGTAVLCLALGAPMLAEGAGASVAPACVVSLSPTATETLYAIGAGRQVQAVDKDSNYPTKGLPPASKRIDALNPSVEAILGICKATAAHPSTKPDLVIISYDANSIKEKLRALNVKVVEQDAPTNLGGAYAQIRQLGALTGHVVAARRLATSIARAISADVASVPAHPNKTINVYYELDPTYYSVTSSTFVGLLMKRLGLVNIADAQSTSADAGYPQLNAEYIVSANPQLVFLADTICCQANPASFGARPGFGAMSAVVHAHVVGLNDDVASRWGPRLRQLMGQITSAVRRTLADTSLWG